MIYNEPGSPIINAKREIFNAPLRKAGIWQAIDTFKDMDMKVLRNYSFQAKIPSTIDELKYYTEADQPWSEEHFLERVKGKPFNPGKSYKKWPYNSFDKEQDPYMDGKVFSHTYMERYWPKQAGEGWSDDCSIDKHKKLYGDNRLGIRYKYGDLNNVIIQLRDNPLTRQAYLPIFFPEDTGAVHKQRIPCTLGYLFDIWDGKLDCTYYIRSCDIFRHFSNDIYLTSRLMQYIAQRIISLRVGTLTMHIANLHLFVNDEYAFKKNMSWRE